jgi:hypothetical protein
MKFFEIFKNKNDYNEKTVIGFMAFAIMALTAITDVVTGVWGIKLEIHEFVYQAFVMITLGSFGIAGLEKFSPSEHTKAKAQVKEEVEEDFGPDPE